MDVLSLTEFNQERYYQIIREEGREEGLQEARREMHEKGCQEGEVIGYIHMGEKMRLTSQDIIQFIVEETGVSSEEAKRLYEEYKEK